MQTLKKQLARTVGITVSSLSITAGAGVVYSAGTAAAVSCSVLPNSVCSKADDGSVSSGGVFELLKWVLRIMTGLVGIAAVGGLVWAGMLYGSASSSNEQVKHAKTIITDVVVGLVAYALMFIVVNWLIPGGVVG